jgi:uncharacterized protein (TIGR02145 family)
MKRSIIIWIFLVLVLILIRCEKETNSLPMDGDGNRYDTIVFGEQTWLTENLKTTKYINGDPIRLVTDDSEWSERTQGAYCWYENNINFKDIYGALYNGYVAKASNFICPMGYHVPTIDEWLRLSSYLETSSEEIKQSFKIQGIGFRLGDGPFTAFRCSWWSASDGYPNIISTSFVPAGTGNRTGLFIRCIRNN